MSNIIRLLLSFPYKIKVLTLQYSRPCNWQSNGIDLDSAPCRWVPAVPISPAAAAEQRSCSWSMPTRHPSSLRCTWHPRQALQGNIIVNIDLINHLSFGHSHSLKGIANFSSSFSSGGLGNISPHRTMYMELGGDPSIGSIPTTTPQGLAIADCRLLYDKNKSNGLLGYSASDINYIELSVCLSIIPPIPPLPWPALLPARCHL